MLPLQNVPFAGYAVRFAAIQLPATAQIVAASMLGLSVTKDWLVEGGSKCNPWCSTPPSPEQLARTAALGSVPLTSAYAAIAAFRSPEKFSKLLPTFLLGPAAGSLFINPLVLTIGSAMTGGPDSEAVIENAFVGSLYMTGIELGILLVYRIGR